MSFNRQTRASRAIPAAIVFLVILLFPGKCFSDEKAVKLLSSLKKKFSEVETFQGTFTVNLEGREAQNPYSKMAASGVISVSGDLVRMETRMRMVGTDKQEPIEMDGLFVLSRNVLWEFVERISDGSKSPPFLGKMDVEALRKEFPGIFGKESFSHFFNPAAGITQLETKNLHYVGEEVVAPVGVKTAVFESTPRFVSEALDFPIEEGAKSTKVKAWIGLKDGITYQTAVLDEKGNPLMSFRFTQVRLNPPVDSKEFVFTPPKDASLTDLTPAMKEMIRKESKQ